MGAAEPVAHDTLADKGGVMQGLWRCRARVSVGKMREETLEEAMSPWKLVIYRLSGCVRMSRGKTVNMRGAVTASNPILVTLRNFSVLLRTRVCAFGQWEAVTAIAFILNVPDGHFTPRRIRVSSRSSGKQWEGVSLVLSQTRLSSVVLRLTSPHCGVDVILLISTIWKDHFVLCHSKCLSYTVMAYQVFQESPSVKKNWKFSLS